ncbi:MAG: PAS domain-containing protein, partial [Sulfuritalea sp.]|nr:PAS domain-containing protein [Sulfuritalea sp.]
MKIFNKLSLKARVTATVALVFVFSLAIFTGVARKNIREDILALSSQQQIATATVAAAQLNQDFDDRLKGLSIGAKIITQAMVDNPALLEAEMNRRPILSLLFNDGLYLIKPDGTTITDQLQSTQPFADQASINAVLSGQVKSIVGAPMLDAAHQAPLFLIVTAISNEQGQVIGALVGATSLAKANFTDKVTNNKYGKTGGFTIIDPKHRIIVSATDKSRNLERSPPPGKIAFIDKFLAGYEGASVGINPKGVEVLESSKIIPLAGWQLLVALPTSEIFTPIRALSNLRFFTSSIATLILMIALAWWTLKKPFRPMTEAANTLEKWAEHPESSPEQQLVVHQQDEVGTLIKAFNQLLAINREREADLTSSREEYKKLAIVAQTTTNMVTITDRHSHLLWVNPGFIEHTGYSEAFMLGKKPGHFLQGADTNQDTVKIIRGAIKHHKGFDVEILNYKKSGEPYWSHIIATPIDKDDANSGYVSIQVDVTEQKQVQAMVERDREDKEALFDSNPNPMVVVNSQRYISYVNPAFCQLFKVKTQQILFLPELEFDKLIQTKCTDSKDYIATSSLPINDKLKAGQTEASTSNSELGFSLKLDEVKVIARHYIDCNLPRISRVIYYQDITQRSVIDKMKSEFVATAAHELRTPMTIIYGYTELLRMGPEHVAEQQEMLEVIHSQSKAMINLLNDMLDIARIEAQAVGLYQMVLQQIAPRLQTLADTFITPDNHNKVILELSPNLPEVKVDVAKIEQAIKNCLSNAYKFSPKRGEVTMRVEEVTHGKQRKILIA